MLIKSHYDKRQYKPLTLDNGLQILLVHDEDCEKSAAAITVKSGHFNDDIDCQGLSHLLEHSLFLGNELQPEPNALSDRLESMGGNINAQTGTEFTSYFFDVPTEYLEDSIEQFSAMLRSPIFDKRQIQQEILAIDAEFKAKQKDELRRLYQVHKETCNPSHPFSQFSVGNKEIFEALSACQLVSKLKALHTLYYQPQNTTLCIVSNAHLAELETMAIDTFKNWKNKQKIETKKYSALYRQQDLSVKINIQPIQVNHRLIVTFALPNTDSLFRSKPLTVLSHILGDEGEGGLFDYLKKQGWANNLSAGGGIEGSNFKDFNINIQLTSEGLTKVNQIITTILAFIRLIKEQGIAPWRMQEIADINQLMWDFSDKSKAIDEALHFSQVMFEYPKKYWLSGDYILDEFEPERVLQILGFFTAQNMRVKFVSPSVQTDQKAKWYQTPYSVEQFLVEEFKTINSAELSLAKPNPFLFKTCQLKDINLDFDTPQKLIEQSGLHIWYGQDSQFRQPKGDCFLTFDCEAVNQGLEIVTAKRLWIALLNEKLNQRYYQANLAGMHFHFYPHQGGFSLQTNGFSRNQLEFYTKLLTQVVLTDDFSAQFNQIKQQQIQGLSNRLLNKPINRLFSRLAVLMQQQNYLPSDMADAMKSLTAADVNQSKMRLMNNFHLEGLMYGDWTLDDAMGISDVLKTFRQNHQTGHKINRGVADIKTNRVILHPVVCQHPDNAVVIYFQSPNSSIYTTALTILLEQLIASPFFNQLRTQQQLGYIVGTGYVPYNQSPGLALYVQSPHVPVNDLIMAIHAFLQQLLENIEKYAVIWESIKKGVIKQVSQNDTSLSMKSQRLWLAIGNKDYKFTYANEMVTAIKNLEISHLKSFFQQMLNLQNFGEIILYCGQLDDLPKEVPTEFIGDPREFKLKNHYC